MSSWIGRPKLLHQCLDWTSEADADRVAIATADGTTSRRALRAMAEAVAARLAAAGLQAGDRVAVLAGKTPDALAAFLGASWTGVVYVPLDARAEPVYWRTVMSDLGVRALLTDREVDTAAVSPVQVLPLAAAHGVPARPAGADAVMARHSRSADDAAYILTTSGSTGRPKGVLTSHENALSFVDWSVERLGIGPGDVVLGTAPIHFAWSVMHIYGALHRGARLVLAPELAPQYPGLLVQAIEAHRVSVFSTVPTVLSAMLDVGAFAGGATASLRAIVYSGEPFPPATLARVMRALPHVELFNFFGSTETKVVLAHRLETVPADGAEVALGTPASFADVRLVDETGAEVADGEVGQISVAGPSVMKGYVTAEGFAPASSPFVMGDFARRGEGGVLYYRGRRDQQVKVRGNRISLPAVDAALLACPGVKEAVTYAVGQDLVACICAEEPPLEADLAAACRARLPSSSQPHRYVMLPDFPRLSNGKIDRVRLRAIAAGDV